MILEYRCKNFMSFEEEIEFTAMPQRVTDRYKGNVYTYGKHKHALKSAVIFGENTGGKTNFIKSLDFLKKFIDRRVDKKLYKDLTFLRNNEEQLFHLKCLISDRIYTYELILNNAGIERELLYVHSKSNKYSTVLLSYTENKNISHKQLKEEYLVRKILPLDKNYINGEKLDLRNTDQSFFFGNKFFEWIKESLVIELNEQTDSWIYNLEKSESILNIINKEEFLNIFKIIDSTIKEIKIDTGKPFEYTQIIREMENGEKFVVDLKDDSMGVRDFFKLSINLYKVIYYNCVVIADEVDRVLNVIISNKIIKLIHGSEHKGQFIFTTHNIMNLSTALFIKSQIYFITKKEGGLSSELYSLADFEDFRTETKDVYKYYLKGMFGGTPNV